jgi:hypothetical protein
MKLGKLATFLIVIISFLPAQLEKVEHKPNPTKMVDFGDLAEGPYQKLVIRNPMVIPGHGGRVAYGTDDNYQWSTGGFGNIRELQLVLESGMHPLEVLQSATHNSAQTILEPKLGMIQK